MGNLIDKAVDTVAETIENAPANVEKVVDATAEAIESIPEVIENVFDKVFSIFN